MTAPKPHPPRWATRLLEWYCAPHLLEEVQGDLEEEFDYQLQVAGARRAKLDYIRNVLGFIRPFSIKRKPPAYPLLPFFYPVMLRNHFTIAWRQLTRHKVFTLIHVLGLSLGICACLIIYLITAFEFSFDRFHPDRERIYRVVGQVHYKTGETMLIDNVPSPAPTAMQQELTGLEKVAAVQLYQNVRVNVPEGKQPAQKVDSRQEGGATATVVVGPEYFEVFPYQWLAGNQTTALQEPFTVVLSQKAARTYFGDRPLERVLGKEVIYNDSLRVRVTGIVKDWQQNTDLGFTDFISLATAEKSFLQREFLLHSWEGMMHSSMAFVKLMPGTAADQVKGQLAILLKKHKKPDPRASLQLTLQPLSDVHFNTAYPEYPYRKAHLPTLYGSLAVALFILLLAAINFVNLATAQSLKRAKEIGVRKVLGSSRGSLVFQFLTETGLLTCFALGLALLLVKPILSAFEAFIPKGVTFHLLDPVTLVFLLGMTLLTGLLAGLYPAKVLSAYLPVLTLKGALAQVGKQRGYLRKSLIVFQFTISLCFIISTIVISSQIHFMQTQDLGFRPERVINLRTNWGEPARKAKVLAQQLEQVPGIEQVILESAPPMGFMRLEFLVKYKGKPEQEFAVSVRPNNENYVPFYGIKLLAGRNLLPSDTVTEYLINETCAKKLGFTHAAEAVGSFLYSDDKAIPIVGVVGDFHQFSFREAIGPVVISNIAEFQKNLAVKLAASDANPVLVLPQIEKQWKQLYPDTPFSYSFLEESITWEYDKEQKTAYLMHVAMGITIFISCLGILGLSLFTAEQKRKEIGIRKALGASVTSIVTLLSKEFVRLVLMAVGVASPLAWYGMNKWLQEFAYRVSIEWWFFGLAAASVVVTALLTISFQTIKAARANPVESLRNE